MNSECQLVPFFRYHVGTLPIKKLVQFSYKNCTNWPLGHSFFDTDLFNNKIAATNLRKLMLQSAWKISPEIKAGQRQESGAADFKKHRARTERKLFVNLLIYRGVLELDGPHVRSWRTETDFWKTMVKEGAASLLRVSFQETPQLLGRYLHYLLALEKLRIIKIPNLLCSNKQLESIAVRLPCLR